MELQSLFFEKSIKIYRIISKIYLEFQFFFFSLLFFIDFLFFSFMENFANYKPKGKILGKYFFLFDSILSKSEFSSVYLGGEVDSNKIYVIRVIHYELIGSYLTRKFSFLKYLNHPNIVYCHDHLISANNHYFIMEFCSNGNLSSYLQVKGQVLESEALSIIINIILGYREIFMKGLLHGGLKPDNILIHEGIFKFEDFGLA